VRVGGEETADVRAIALKVFADGFYWKYRSWKCAQGDKEARMKELEIYERFLKKYGDALSEEERRSIEHRIEYARNGIEEAEKAERNYYDALVEEKKSVEKLLGESLCSE